MRLTIDTIPIDLISSAKEIPVAMAWLNQCTIVAVDSESNSLFSYYEKVCLIQFSCCDRHAIFDALALKKIPQLGALFQSNDVQKVFHAAEYDILCMKRDFGFQFNNLFDTMVAARILGKKEVGLGALLASEMDIYLDKKYQKANWSLRPIPEKMLSYAIHDTNDLIALKEKLERELMERNLMDVAHEDFLRLCNLPAGSAEPEKTNWWKAAGSSNGLTPAQEATLQTLCEWREELAKKANVPTFKIIQNKVLLGLVTEPPRKKSELLELAGIRKSLAEKHGDEMMRMLTQQQPREVPRPRRSPVPSAAALKRRKRLKDWRKNTGIKNDVPSDVILPKDVMEQIITVNPKNSEQLGEIMAELPWRFNRFSDEILQVLAKAKE